MSRLIDSRFETLVNQFKRNPKAMGKLESMIREKERLKFHLTKKDLDTLIRWKKFKNIVNAGKKTPPHRWVR